MREPSVEAKVAWNEGKEILAGLPEPLRKSLSIGEGENVFDRYYSTAGEGGAGAFGARFSLKEAGVSYLNAEQRMSLKKIATEHGVKFRKHEGGVLEFNRQGFNIEAHFAEGAKEAKEREELKGVIPSALPHEHGDVQAVLAAVKNAFNYLQKER